MHIAHSPSCAGSKLKDQYPAQFMAELSSPQRCALKSNDGGGAILANFRRAGAEAACRALLLLVVGCHSINTASSYGLQANTAKGELTTYSIKAEDTLVKVETPQDGERAVSYCTKLRDDARTSAKSKEVWGFILGPVGLISAGIGTGVAAKASGTTDVAIASGVAASGVVLTGIAAYLLTSAAFERTGEGLLTAGLVQMGQVDAYFITPPVSTSTDSTVTETKTENRSKAGVTTTQKTTTQSVTTTSPTTETKTVITESARPTDGASPVSAEQDDGLKKEIKTVVVKHQLHVVPSEEDAEHVRWQTCAKVIATWQTGAGASDLGAAGSVKPSK